MERRIIYIQLKPLFLTKSKAALENNANKLRFNFFHIGMWFSSYSRARGFDKRETFNNGSPKCFKTSNTRMYGLTAQERYKYERRPAKVFYDITRYIAYELNLILCSVRKLFERMNKN